MSDLSVEKFAKYVDHTLLRTDATLQEINALLSEAEKLGVYSICVSPSNLSLINASKSEVKIATVCGFPSGNHSSATKAFEAAEAVRNGADEIDMVINLSQVKSGDFNAVRDDIAEVRKAAPKPVVLKVIIESAALNDDEIIACCKAAVEAEADFVKTSTGFHAAGGASEHAVALMRKTVGQDFGVKASGGIRTAASAKAMISAGANRLGLSGTAQIIAELNGEVNIASSGNSNSQY